MNNTKSPHVQEENQNTLGYLQNPPKLYYSKMCECWRNTCSKLSRVMSEMTRWQEQDSGSEKRFQHNNSSSKIGEEKG